MKLKILRIIISIVGFPFFILYTLWEFLVWIWQEITQK